MKWRSIINYCCLVCWSRKPRGKNLSMTFVMQRSYVVFASPKALHLQNYVVPDIISFSPTKCILCNTLRTCLLRGHHHRITSWVSSLESLSDHCSSSSFRLKVRFVAVSSEFWKLIFPFLNDYHRGDDQLRYHPSEHCPLSPLAALTSSIIDYTESFSNKYLDRRSSFRKGKSIISCLE